MDGGGDGVSTRNYAGGLPTNDGMDPTEQMRRMAPFTAVPGGGVRSVRSRWWLRPTHRVRGQDASSAANAWHLVVSSVMAASVLLLVIGALPAPSGLGSLSLASPTRTVTPPPTALPGSGGGTGGGGNVQPSALSCRPRTHLVPYVIRSGPAKKYVALTFDDGPGPDYTATILATLERTHTPATFFVVGLHVQRYPGLVRREAHDGFAIGIHTWDHPVMTRLSPAQRAWELSSTVQALHRALGSTYCLPYWRPPYGNYNKAVVAQARSMGLSTVTWDVDPRDWSAPGVRVIVSRVLSAVHPGAIILLHDGYAFRRQTAQALPLIINGLKRRGYVPVTLPVLLAGGH